jgi:hypothetical protein
MQSVKIIVLWKLTEKRLIFFCLKMTHFTAILFFFKSAFSCDTVTLNFKWDLSLPKINPKICASFKGFTLHWQQNFKKSYKEIKPGNFRYFKWSSCYWSWGKTTKYQYKIIKVTKSTWPRKEVWISLFFLAYGDRF